MTDSPTAIGLGFVAFALLVLAIRVVQMRLTPTARLEHVTPTGARDGSGDCPQRTCVAPLCCEPATIRLSVGHDYWPLCIGHGLPILTGELTS